MKIPVTYRSQGEYTAWLAGVTAVAEAVGLEVDAMSWGGGIPNEVTLVGAKFTVTTSGDASSLAVGDDEPDIFEREAEAANDGDDGQSAPSA